jgi:hypothetical protein
MVGASNLIFRSAAAAARPLSQIVRPATTSATASQASARAWLVVPSASANARPSGARADGLGQRGHVGLVVVGLAVRVEQGRDPAAQVVDEQCLVGLGLVEHLGQPGRVGARLLGRPRLGPPALVLLDAGQPLRVVLAADGGRHVPNRGRAGHECLGERGFAGPDPAEHQDRVPPIIGHAPYLKAERHSPTP